MGLRRTILKRTGLIGLAFVFLVSTAVGSIVWPSSQPVSAIGDDSCDYSFFENNGIFAYDPCQPVCQSPADSTTGDLPGATTAEKIWNFYLGKGLTPVAAAGVVGNYSVESGLDPAIKQNQSSAAIPVTGDGVTGYGIAQWTSKGRQAGLFTIMQNDKLDQYLGAGWGATEENKMIPAADSEKLLSDELNYSWSGDSTPIQSFESQLNAATSVDGDSGSALIFHNTFEVSADTATMLQSRVAAAAKLLQQFGNAVNCNGILSNVKTLQDGAAWANQYVTDTIAKYHADGSPLSGGSATLLPIYNFGHNDATAPVYCWKAADCGQCVAMSGWFVTNMTDYTFGAGNGGDVVNNLAKMGVTTGTQPQSFSIFSIQDGSYGHTGVVLAVLSDGSIITLEANYNSGGAVGVQEFSSVSALTRRYGSSINFAYVGQKLKADIQSKVGGSSSGTTAQ